MANTTHFSEAGLHQCHQVFATSTSKLDVGGSLYNDFPYIHRAVVHISHEQPSFLSWYRYFVHIFESRLRISSPVFDTQLGFGGNGDYALRESLVGGGHCVTSGPFAMTLARYVGLEVKLHCVSRIFRNDTATGHFTGQLIRPELVGKYVDEDDLLLFTLKLESAPYNTILFGIRGNFLSFNAPADPLFFLHHAQLDRLRWKWQHMRPERRNSYSTRRSFKPDEMTSLNDMIEMG
ncbi:related to monophenol monooxygenase [Phialocephala subalpina]|uniref:Related to monophenol monooxygenase n=1 Tax=Phialocephala subalpina TaxID=576137 RepID=A0A1L7XXI3_9HELO|nr:related to monophenol monooxygenase [Phialocephala subalpina]